MEQITEKILVSGPWVSDLEVAYAADAARNGWNQHCFDYINKFENNARQYLGVDYALGVSSCTAALHLAMLGLGIGPGDEVIVPESTWIATANAVEYVGATPIFVDIDADSWTIDPIKIEKAITPKTKAIIVVHLYGHPCDMQKIMEIAKAHQIYVVEDAAQAMGGMVCGKKTGAIGDVGCFSFHGSKSVVMGEGGLLVTNRQDVYEKAKFFSDQGKDASKRFYNTATAYKYKLSNLQAAFGAAQMERVDEIVGKKRELFSWYQEKLQGLEDIQLNAELFKAKNTYWMPTLVLGESYAMNGSQLSEELLKRNIDTRPFFYPLTMMPMYETKRRKDTEVAYKYFEKAINLPAGCCLTEEEVDYICVQIKFILKPEQYVEYSLKGWLKYREWFKQKIAVLQNDSRFSDYRIIKVDFQQRLVEVENKQAKSDEMIRLGKLLEAAAIYVRCDGGQAKELIENGFEEVTKTPQVYRNGMALDLIKADFEKPETYEYLVKINL